MNKMNAIIIDDEKHARELLRLELEEHCPKIHIESDFSNIQDAKAYLDNKKIDVVFLDIEMPGGNGLELLKKYPEKDFYPIIVTSHIDYAIDAIKEEAFDFLLKPICPERLKESVERLAIKLSSKKKLVFGQEKNRLKISDRKSTYFLKTAEILYLEADGSYTDIYSIDNKYTVSRNLKYLHSKLSNDHFFRISHRVVVNMNFVKKINKEKDSVILESGSEFSLSVRRREGFFDQMKRI